MAILIKLQHQLSTLSSAEPGCDNVEKIAVSLLNFSSAGLGSDNFRYTCSANLSNFSSAEPGCENVDEFDKTLSNIFSLLETSYDISDGMLVQLSEPKNEQLK